jgi:hypothetical protein
VPRPALGRRGPASTPRRRSAAGSAAPATPDDRAALPAGLAAAVARAGVNPTAEPRQLQDALKAAIADRRGSVEWDVDRAGWIVELLRPERETFRGGTLEEALTWCLVWPMAGAPGDLAVRPGFRLGWGRFPDGAEVLYLYGRDDGGFGYAVNLTAPECSEWGYAPFG